MTPNHYIITQMYTLQNLNDATDLRKAGREAKRALELINTLVINTTFADTKSK